MFAIIQAAGWPIWPLLLASIISVALIIERLVALRRSKVVPSGLLRRAVGEFKRGANNDRMLEDLERHSPLGRVLAAGLRNVNTSREVMKESIEEAGAAVTHELNRYLTTLGTIASISPLMGLFGTVVGIMTSFQAIAGSKSTNLAVVAPGIAEALLATAIGLLAALRARGLDARLWLLGTRDAGREAYGYEVEAYAAGRRRGLAQQEAQEWRMFWWSMTPTPCASWCPVFCEPTASMW